LYNFAFYILWGFEISTSFEKSYLGRKAQGQSLNSARHGEKRRLCLSPVCSGRMKAQIAAKRSLPSDSSNLALLEISHYCNLHRREAIIANVM
jgi:hypothetical protein